MRTPGHWSGSASLPARLLARLLSPFGWLYGAATAWRMGRPGRRARLPVICVGNLTAGGAGKTPVVLMLGRALMARGERPFVVSRGYGGRLVGPERVEPARMTAADCGDEPLLIARELPVVVARDRAAGAALAERQGATLVILDDGLQNPGLAKDFTVAVVDAEAGFGNGLCIPAGPLRAPIDRQMPRIDAFLLLGGDGGPEDRLGLRRWGKPVHAARIEPDEGAIAALRGLPLLAFAGIGRPEKFFRSLRDAGLDVRASRAFADHHSFTPADLAALKAEAQAKGLTLVTTEKDAMRLPAGAEEVRLLPVRIAPADGPLVEAAAAAIARRRSAP
jgi:tetraacyldisaccharide 4'-kinase